MCHLSEDRELIRVDEAELLVGYRGEYPELK